MIENQRTRPHGADNPEQCIKRDPVRLSCYVCESLIEPRLILKSLAHPWNIVRCPECQLAFVHPQPDLPTIKAYYDGLYSTLAEQFDDKKMAWARQSVSGYVSVLSQYRTLPKGATLLDLGGGLGYYSKAFAEAGFSVTLVEQDPVSAEFARSVLKVENLIESGAGDFMAANRNQYDVVLLRHVIEHARDPREMIQGVQSCLADGGILIIETDNNAGIELMFHPGTAFFYRNLYRSSYAGSSFLSLIGKRPFAVDPPRHLFGFRLANLTALLEKNALRPLKTECYRLGHPVYWPNTPLPTIRDVLRDSRHGRIKRLAAHALDLGFFPLRLLLEYAGLASGICVYAIKKPA